MIYARLTRDPFHLTMHEIADLSDSQIAAIYARDLDGTTPAPIPEPRTIEEAEAAFRTTLLALGADPATIDAQWEKAKHTWRPSAT